MTCKNIFKPFFLFLSLGCLALITYAQGPDAVYVVPKTPFLDKILSLSDLKTSINLSEETNIIPLKNTPLSFNGQKLYKTGDTIFVIIEQTGFVYRLSKYDSVSYLFQRLDHTINLNYNIDCKNFIYKNDLYSYGGYGFWKSNGQLRKFNFQDSEWDIIPLNKEIISTHFLWFSEKTGRLYMPYQRIVNAGIIGGENITGVPIYTSYYLDVNAQKWEELGALDPDIINIVKDVNTNKASLSYENGILFLSNDAAYVFDYINDKVYKSKNANLNQFLIRRHDMANIFIHKDKIYSYNLGSKSFITYPFKMTDFNLLNIVIWGIGPIFYYSIMGFFIIVILVVGSIWFFNRSVKRKLQLAQLQILKNKNSSQAFNSIEISLIILLLNSTLKGKVVEINQINHVLGVKDKNVGLQKKVRSDVMKAINEKYEFITQSSTNLIDSSRKEDDKRYYEYFIASTEINTIQRILEKNS